ncbi:hypothetical protein SLS58_001387 [Diplodia intermedia]|uniref:Uncharacterized protein n=1 Tax=Diplodia intermedia TaxID=856260 RepID=A0ABR3U305_9PEZI
MVTMAPDWVVAHADDKFANELRAACVSFLSDAAKQGDVLPPNIQYPPDLGSLTIYRCHINRPFKGLDLIWTYAWYKATPAWSTDSLWAVRIDYFIPHFFLPLHPALSKEVNGEDGKKQLPVTFFTTKEILSGGFHAYHRWMHQDGAIHPRSHLGYLDPLATSDINATNPLLGDAFHSQPLRSAAQTQKSPVADEKPYSSALTKIDPGSPASRRSRNSFVKGARGTFDDPFKSSGSGSRSVHASFGDTPGSGVGNGSLSYGSLEPGHNVEKLARPDASANAKPGETVELLIKKLNEASRTLRAQEKALREQSMQLEAQRKKSRKSHTPA